MVLERILRIYIIACLVLICICLFISNRNDLTQTVGELNTNDPTKPRSLFDINGRRRLAEPGGADWRKIFRDIQQKRKKEEEEKKRAAEKDSSGSSSSEEDHQHDHQQQHREENKENTDKTERPERPMSELGKQQKANAEARRARKQKEARDDETGSQQNQYTPERAFYHEFPDSHRFESDETWRPPEMFPDTGHVQRSMARRQYGQQALQKSVPSKAEYIKQDLPHDFATGTDRIFLMLKTGYTVQWDRVPMHLVTTLTKFPNFGIYSDAASSVAGYEVMDILADLPESVMADTQLELYKEQQRQRRDHIPPLRDGSSPLNGHAWVMDKFKNMPILKHAWETSPDKDWYLMIDDDTSVFADNLGRWLKTLDPSKPYYLGSAVAGLKHIFAHGGSGIVLSRALMKMAFQAPDTDAWMEEYAQRALKECCGDYVLAAFLKEKLSIDLDINVSGNRFQGEAITKVACNSQNWCTELATFHHATPRDIELLWEYDRMRGYYPSSTGDSLVFSPADGPSLFERPPITYADIYTDFVKPYLMPMRDHWNNNAKEIQYSWSLDYSNGDATIEDYSNLAADSDKPYASVDNCRSSCLSNPDCLMFRHDSFQRYCGLSTSVALGIPAPPSTKQPGDDDVAYLLKDHGVDIKRGNDVAFYSEWRFDRIEAMRAQISCDPKNQGDIPDIDDSKEGWFWHARDKFENES